MPEKVPEQATTTPAGGSMPVAGPLPVAVGRPTTDGPWSVRALLRWIQSHLEERGVESPRVCAEILVGHVLGCDRLRLYMEPERVPTEAERTRLRSLVLRAGKHEPVQYLVGSWSFLGREFEVGPSTLIPRPATETLVERAVEWYRSTMVTGGVPQPLRMADLGTGTGIIAISVLLGIRSGFRSGGCKPLGGAALASSEAGSLPTIQVRGDVAASAPSAATGSTGPSLRCLATDVVPEAVELARRNVARHALGGAIDVRAGSLFEPFRGSKPNSFDLLCSNPPYVSDEEWNAVLPNVKNYEPTTALRAGPEGLDVITPLVAEAPKWLRSGGLLLMEIGDAQRDRVLQLVGDRTIWSSAEVVKDFEDLWRVLVAVRQ